MPILRVYIYILYIYGPVSRVPTPPPMGWGGYDAPVVVYIHTYIPTYLPTYIPTYIHTYIPLHYLTLHYLTLPYITLPYIPYIHTYIPLHYITLPYITLPYLTLPYLTFHTYIHTYIYRHTHIHTYIHTQTHTHTYIHTYQHTYIHTNIPTYQHTTTTGHRGGGPEEPYHHHRPQGGGDQKNHTTTTGHGGGGPEEPYHHHRPQGGGGPEEPYHHHRPQGGGTRRTRRYCPPIPIGGGGEGGWPTLHHIYYIIYILHDLYVCVPMCTMYITHKHDVFVLMYNDTDIVSRWFAVGNHPDDPMGGDPGDPAPGPTTGRVGQGGVLVLEWDEVDWLVVWNMKELWLSIYIYYICIYCIYKGNNNLNWRTHIFQRGWWWGISVYPYLGSSSW